MEIGVAPASNKIGRDDTGADEHALVVSYDRRPPIDARLGSQAKRVAKRKAQRGLCLLLGAVGWVSRDRVHHQALQLGDPAVRRILVVRVDLIGDVVLSLPAVRALRRAYPDAEIDMLVLHSTAPILDGERDVVARVITFDPHVWRRPSAVLKPGAWRDAVKLLRTLRSARYDLAVSISGDIGSILTRLSGARRSVGYAAEAYAHFLTDPLPGGRYRTHQHEVRYVLALAERAGCIVTPADEELLLHVTPDAHTSACELLCSARAAMGARGPVVAMHLGARNGQAKRWPPEHFAALADQLVDELDALVVLTGAPNEAPLAEAVVRRAQRPVVDLVGSTSIPELVALLAESEVLVTGDSGPMHIACAVSTPVVALHGPTDPALSGPTARDALVLRHRLWCAPCYDASATAECRFGNPVCMKDLRPALVLDAVRRQLRRGRRMVEAGANDARETAIQFPA
jgi:lipopolysaccharide heptosyltransferase II